MIKRQPSKKSTVSRHKTPRPVAGAAGQSGPAALARVFILTRNGGEFRRAYEVLNLQSVARLQSEPGDRWEIQPATKLPGETLVILRMDHGERTWDEISPDVA